MTKEELDHQKNVHRVGCNLLVLLDTGLFPGKHALGLEEAKGFVSAIVKDAEEKMQPQVVPPPPSAPPLAAA